MRVGLVRKLGFTLLALGMVGLGGCNDDPLDFDEQTAVRMFTNPSFMVVRTGDSVQFVANGINAGNEPTFEPVTATVASCGGTGSISVIESAQQTSIQPPQIYNVIGGAALGGACVVVQSGSATDTVDVVVVGGFLNVTSAPTSIVAGTGGTISVELVGVDGTPVTPFDPSDVTWTSDNSAVLTVDASGNVTNPGLSGSATITAAWTGTDATGTSGQNVNITATAPIIVVPDVPIAAAFGGAFPALAVGAQGAVPVLVTDQFGNQVTDSTQVLSISVMSDDTGVATVTDNFAPDALGALAVTATGVAAGAANISGIVTTSGTSIDLAYGPSGVSVLDPQIAAVPPSNPTTSVAITGSGFVAAGFATTVLVDGLKLANFTVVDDANITAEMPSFGTAGDYDVTVDVGGVVSPPVAWTQLTGFSDATTEPANDNPGAAFISIPFVFSGVLGTGGETDDFFQFTVSDDVTVDFFLNWTPAGSDNDILITDAAVTAFVCVDGATGANPEHSVCALTAGDYQYWLNDYDGDGVTKDYNADGTVQ